MLPILDTERRYSAYHLDTVDVWCNAGLRIPAAGSSSERLLAETRNDVILPESPGQMNEHVPNEATCLWMFTMPANSPSPPLKRVQ
jgi:hypothetical protein